MGAKVERPDAAELRAVLDATLRAVDDDPKLGPLVRATGLRMCFRITDIGLVLNIAAGDDHLRWEFSDDVDWESKLDLEMSSETANAFLQGKESLAIGIARGKVKCRGDARAALVYLPATRLLAQRYRQVVLDTNPNLVVV